MVDRSGTYRVIISTAITGKTLSSGANWQISTPGLAGYNVRFDQTVNAHALSGIDIRPSAANTGNGLIEESNISDATVGVVLR